MAKKYWIMKGEPGEFGIDDLEKKGTALWDGVRNYQVRNMFRDVMKAGDKALFYHSNCKEVGVVGEVDIIEAGVPDTTQFDKKSKYFDAKSDKANPRWVAPIVRFKKKFTNRVPLDVIKSRKEFADNAFVKRGNRLSVTEINKEQFELLVKLGGK